ncbi:putative ABC transporter permease [Anaerosacchariphilus polymeriproducens]|uniref:ABC transporter permease n=1 Tax=Anaerosacchariphilus polymeriproducens TaxID=1812858 RepID=A0A371AVD2_9FIRM|nr:putative ABC transporter permease [Anaerosacchariphilus polymeriproducens]RDU23538.1 hypothetical protein DWV06_08860 [Anaerosacchariphilus polymeriproducens]
MINTIYQILWLFYIYSFIGWCIEVVYATLNTGKFVNRGFLNGPFCPIYGFGVLVVIILLEPIKENLVILFLGSLVLTSIIEFITGFVLKKVFNNSWWDYTDLPFNLCGYICLKFSIMWGIACVTIIQIIHPAVTYFVKLIPYNIGIIIISLIIISFCFDIIVTINAILELNKRLSLMNEISKKLKYISDELGENISNGVVDIMEISDEWKNNIGNIKVNLDEKKQEIYQLKESYRKLFEKKYIIHKRLMKAFPRMKSKNYQEVLDNLKSYYKNKKLR